MPLSSSAGGKLLFGAAQVVHTGFTRACCWKRLPVATVNKFNERADTEPKQPSVRHKTNTMSQTIVIGVKLSRLNYYRYYL